MFKFLLNAMNYHLEGKMLTRLNAGIFMRDMNTGLFDTI